MEPKQNETLLESTEKDAVTPIRYGHPELSDVVLIVEGREFHLHKMILAYHSPYFKAMFYTDAWVSHRKLSEKTIENQSIKLLGVHVTSFKRLVDFMYNGMISDEDGTIIFEKIGEPCYKYIWVHRHLRGTKEKVKHLKDFWSNNEDMLKLANHFGIRKPFQAYFHKRLSDNICSNIDCFICLNAYMFTLANTERIDILDKMEPEQNETQPDSTKKNSLSPIKYGDPELSDIVLKIKDQEFHVHKMILASNSSYFKTMFYSNFKEKNENIIELKDITIAPFRRLMDLMYNGMISDEAGTIVFEKIEKPGHSFLWIHKPLANKKAKRRHIQEFWKNNEDMMELAERFDMRDAFQVYLNKRLTDNVCSDRDCFICLTSYMYTLANTEYVDILDKAYDGEHIKEWLECSENAMIWDPKIDFLAYFLDHFK